MILICKTYFIHQNNVNFLLKGSFEKIKWLNNTGFTSLLRQFS